MAYTSTNFKTKKELKAAVEAGEEVTVFSPGPFPAKANGTEYVEGPQYPQPHRWYASVEVRNGVIVRVNK
jgi:hypothetical protein